MIFLLEYVSLMVNWEKALLVVVCWLYMVTPRFFICLWILPPTTYTRDAIWMNGHDIVIREYLAYGTLSHGANPCGLLTVLGGDWIDNKIWNYATRDAIYLFDNSIIYVASIAAYGFIITITTICGTSSSSVIWVNNLGWNDAI